MKPTPVVVRSYRLSRAALHLIEGLATTAFVFPFAGRPARVRMIRGWSRRLLSILAVEFDTSGHDAGLPERVLIVANHISWLDIFVLNAHHPSRFIAKSEIRRWPVVGRLVTNVGTLYLDRARRRDAARINAQVEEALAAGDAIALFPEGTTTYGRELLPFHGSLIQPVIVAGGHVVPAAIRYSHVDGSHSDAASYVGEESLLQSVNKLLRARRTRVRLHLCAPFPTAGLHRREVAEQAQRNIRTALELPDDASPAAGTLAGRPRRPE